MPGSLSAAVVGGAGGILGPRGSCAHPCLRVHCSAVCSSLWEERGSPQPCEQLMSQLLLGK